jgi:hypothetical protein
VVSATDPHGRIIGFLDWSRYNLFQVAPHEAERTPFQIHCLSENLVAPGIEPGTFESVARNSEHQTTEAANNTFNTWILT